MIIGGVHVVAGFYGAVNSGISDNYKKCNIFGCILLGSSILNIIILSLITDVVGNRFNIILLLIPVVIALLYCLGAFLNTRMIQKRIEENED